MRLAGFQYVPNVEVVEVVVGDHPVKVRILLAAPSFSRYLFLNPGESFFHNGQDIRFPLSSLLICSNVLRVSSIVMRRNRIQWI